MRSNPPGDYLKRVARALRKAARKGHRLTMAEASKLLASGRLKADGTLSGNKAKAKTKARAKTKAKTKVKRKAKTAKTKARKTRRKSSRPVRAYAALELDDKVIESLKVLCKLKGK